MCAAEICVVVNSTIAVALLVSPSSQLTGCVLSVSDIQLEGFLIELVWST